MFTILGATGKIGGAAARELRTRGKPVRAVVRNAGKAEALRQLGCEIAVAEYHDASALSAAAVGIERRSRAVPNESASRRRHRPSRPDHRGHCGGHRADKTRRRHRHLRLRRARRTRGQHHIDLPGARAETACGFNIIHDHPAVRRTHAELEQAASRLCRSPACCRCSMGPRRGGSRWCPLRMWAGSRRNCCSMPNLDRPIALFTPKARPDIQQRIYWKRCRRSLIERSLRCWCPKRTGLPH